MHFKSLALSALTCVALLSAPIPTTSSLAGPAVNQFELKDLEAEQGSIEFQSQNAHSWDQPNRKFATDDDNPGEFIYDDNSVAQQRHALEIEMGLTNYLRLRVGVEYEKERLEEPDTPGERNDFSDIKFEEIAGELVAVFVPVPEEGGIGLGMLVELQHVVEEGEMHSVVFGPIIEAKSGDWSAIANLALVKFFGSGEREEDGERERDDKIDFTYGAQVKYQASEQLALAVEAYGTIDRIWGTGKPNDGAERFGDHDLHRIGPLVYYSFDLGDSSGLGNSASLSGDEEEDGAEATLGLGLLFGLNDNTPGMTAKWSVEIEF